MSLPAGWSRIAEDQIEFVNKTARIVKVVFRASGGGHMYVIHFKDRKGTWCRHPSSPQDLTEATTLGEQLAGQEKT